MVPRMYGIIENPQNQSISWFEIIQASRLQTRLAVPAKHLCLKVLVDDVPRQNQGRLHPSHGDLIVNCMLQDKL